MSVPIDALLKKYESGQISRRDLIMLLSALLMATPETTGQAPEAPIQARGLNHVTTRVTDIQRSVEFYQSLFGMKIQSRQRNGLNLAAGSGTQFVGIYGGPNAQPGIGHFCLGVENFDADQIMETLEQRGVQARVRMRDDTIPEIYLRAPDGISVQLQDVTYCGGSGSLGNSCP